MAIYNSLAVGTVRKSAGSVTYVSIKGQKVFKQKITTTTNVNSAGQVSQRNQLRNVVKAWPYFKAFMMGMFSQVRTTESRFNAYVRLFINAVVATLDQSAAAILASIPDGIYGSGAGVTDITAVAGAAGVTVTFKVSPDLWLASDTIRAFIFDNTSQSTVQYTGVMGAGDIKTFLIPDAGIAAGDISILGLMAVKEDGKSSGPIQIATVA